MDATKSDNQAITTTINYGDGLRPRFREQSVMKSKEMKNKWFSYAEDICEWANSMQNIEIISIIPDNRKITNSSFVVFYYENNL